MMRNKVCILVPHFGHLQNYFQLFLKSCSYNPDFNWIIFTDDDTEYQFPANVKKIQMTFEELKSLVSEKFSFPVALSRPYKLCDFRPLYGYIFSDYLKGYSHWGHCDTDTIMGNLGKFITDDMLNHYDKIFQLGHLSIYKNLPEINMMALKPFNGRNVGQEILQKNENCWFDEEWNPQENVSINRILLSYGKKIFMEDLSLNVSFSFNRFVRGKFVGVNHTDMPFGFDIEPMKKALYIWDKGELYRLFLDKEQLVKEEFPYTHLQNRPMKVEKNVLAASRFEIIPDVFRPCNFGEVTEENFQSIPKPCRSHLVERLLMKRIVNKLKRMI